MRVQPDVQSLKSVAERVEFTALNLQVRPDGDYFFAGADGRDTGGVANELDFVEAESLEGVFAMTTVVFSVAVFVGMRSNEVTTLKGRELNLAEASEVVTWFPEGIVRMKGRNAVDRHCVWGELLISSEHKP